MKWITKSDPELKDLRVRFAEQYSEIEVGEVCPDIGTAYHYKDYYIQIKPKDFLPKVHFEYWADHNIQGYLDLHLEPTRENPDEMKIYRGIGINLMHVLSENERIKCVERWELPFGCFRIARIRSVDDLLRNFKEVYDIVKDPLLEIYKTKKGALPLQLKYPEQIVEYKPLCNGDEDVTVKIMKLSEVMNLNLTLPDYQREYCWEDHNITEHWRNLSKIQDGKSFHLGTVILHDFQGMYDIIDGRSL